MLRRQFQKKRAGLCFYCIIPALLCSGISFPYVYDLSDCLKQYSVVMLC